MEAKATLISFEQRYPDVTTMENAQYGAAYHSDGDRSGLPVNVSAMALDFSCTHHMVVAESTQDHTQVYGGVLVKNYAPPFTITNEILSYPF